MTAEQTTSEVTAGRIGPLSVAGAPPDLELLAAYNGYWYWGRPTHAELVQDLREITRWLRRLRACRPCTGRASRV